MWRPRLRNRHGTPIDPVPALVVVLTAFLVIYAWGPLYLLTLGFAPMQSVVPLTTLFLAVVAGTYYHLVYTATPEWRIESPSRQPVVAPEDRLSWLPYAIATGIALVVLLALPFLR